MVMEIQECILRDQKVLLNNEIKCGKALNINNITFVCHFAKNAAELHHQVSIPVQGLLPLYSVEEGKVRKWLSFSKHLSCGLSKA